MTDARPARPVGGVARSIVDVIGSTPTIELSRLTRGIRGRIVAKLGYSMPELPLLDGVLVDGHLRVTDEEAIAVARRLAAEEGVFGGFSSGAVVAAGLQLLSGPHTGGTVAVVLADPGLKYLSTDLWPD